MEWDRKPPSTRRGRRALLAGLGATLAGTTAGCSGTGGDDATASTTSTISRPNAPATATPSSVAGATRRPSADRETAAIEPGDADIIVARDGSGDHATVQAAFDAVPDAPTEGPAQETVIYVTPGRYREKLLVPDGKRNVTLVGADPRETVLTYDDHANKTDESGEELGTSRTQTLQVSADGFTAMDLTFENAAEPVAQAVAVQVAGDRAQFERCRFLGNQDTLFCPMARQYYRDCYVEGDVDFIFGAGPAIFESCEIACKPDGGYVTAARTREGRLGFVFLGCRVVSKGAPDDSYLLGRPWGTDANVVFMNSYLGDHVKPVGWGDWGSEMKRRFVRYGEFKNRGPGFTPEQRADWGRQLTPSEAWEYFLEAASIRYEVVHGPFAGD